MARLVQVRQNGQWFIHGGSNYAQDKKNAMRIFRSVRAIDGTQREEGGRKFIKRPFRVLAEWRDGKRRPR